MRTFLLYCPEIKGDLENATTHLNHRGVEFDPVFAIHGETFGLLPSRPYNEDHPGQGHLTPISQVGLTLSHYMLWTALQFIPGDAFMVLESDAKFPMDWKERLFEAMTDLPEDYDIFLIGNSNTSDKEKKHVCGDVWEVFYPFTTHSYIVRKKALKTLLENCRDATVKIDILLIKQAYPKLKVLTMLPALVMQRGTELAV